MTFVSIEFVCLFLAVFVLYFHLPRTYRNPLLLVASAIFYMWWRPVYILIILFSVTVDYFIALKLEHGKAGTRKLLLTVSLVTNLGLLFFFKYYEFAAENLRGLLGWAQIPWQPPVLNLILPIGISFHTFQALSYTIDVYRGQIPVERNLLKLWLYVLFFPQLVAGPIERAGRLLPQFDEDHAWDGERVKSGLRLILWGFVKKAAVADRLAILVDPVFQFPNRFAGLPLLLAMWGFSFEIYADFSGYSDIAVGTARVLGFRLMENFRQPYFAAGIGEFWRRWHISLSTWFRDYLYIPLGGSRKGPVVEAGAILATFVLSGLWHGARWTFVVWGAYHGLLLLLSHAIRSSKRLILGLSSWAQAFITFNLVSVGWVFFRAPSLTDAGTILSRMFEKPVYMPLESLRLTPSWIAVTAVGVAILVVGDLYLALSKNRTGWPTPVRWLAYAAGTILVFSANTGRDIPFIYYQF
jgi:D-alanyl-lipoteichoic acid acyltransferase DltB (MBOAT superfamily)